MSIGGNPTDHPITPQKQTTTDTTLRLLAKG